ncbi:MAG: hypothetical protein RSD57_18870 [Comamonas sp.]
MTGPQALLAFFTCNWLDEWVADAIGGVVGARLAVTSAALLAVRVGIKMPA